MSASGVKSKATTTNPKDLLGNKKIDLSLMPEIATAEAMCAMLDGALKYGPYNWRDKKVRARVYIAAAKRHLALWAEGQERADDSGVHNLGGVIACCSILLDAQTTGNLIDDRPVLEGTTEAFEKAMDRVNAWVVERMKKAQAQEQENGPADGADNSSR